MGKLSKDTFAGVTYAVMGMGTEGGRTPYQITVAAQGGWNGNPLSIASSVAACFPPYGTVISLCLSVFGGLMGNHAPHPPPDGLVSYQLGEDGSITIQTEHNVSGGADTATSTAGSLLGILQSVVDANNANPEHQALAIDPSRLPQVGYTAGTSWIAITQADGSTSKETVHPENIGQRLIELATHNDAIVPQWQVQTLLAHQQAHSWDQEFPSNHYEFHSCSRIFHGGFNLKTHSKCGKTRCRISKSSQVRGSYVRRSLASKKVIKGVN